MRSLHLILAASALALAACQPKEQQAAGGAPPAATPADASAGCNVHVEKDWINQETPLRRYTSEASTMGPTCAQAVVTLAIRARDGTPVFSWSGLTSYLFGLNEAKDAIAMKGALNDWIDQGAGPGDTTDTLPEWETTEGQPKRAEFPFMPEGWFDKAAWDALRKEKLNMFCFPQGMESSNCAVLRPGADGQPETMESIGLQLFPG
jgi:hypothetical protein